ncbi:hypothetical protein AVEN_137347-1 [Araneus ventricosus]|uniref:Uncharacterized protein n=1 Tax=Araneus ventricosus TaxID=182803 RepID=A0A4Y2G604_ARAVE|nr:hypothetical protein AVEN_137347-1 [Araneus ventricosus]
MPTLVPLTQIGCKVGEGSVERESRTAGQHHGQDSLKNQNKKLQTLPEQRQWLKYNKNWQYIAQPTPVGRKTAFTTAHPPSVGSTYLQYYGIKEYKRLSIKNRRYEESDKFLYDKNCLGNSYSKNAFV